MQSTRPNAVSAFRTFVEYILCAYTRMNRITFTYYATSIPRYDLRVVLRVPGEPTATLQQDHESLWKRRGRHHRKPHSLTPDTSTKSQISTNQINECATNRQHTFRATQSSHGSVCTASKFSSTESSILCTGIWKTLCSVLFNFPARWTGG